MSCVERAGWPHNIHFEQQGSDEAVDDGIVGEDPDEAGAAFDFAAQQLDGVTGMQLGAVLRGKGHVTQNCGLSLVYCHGQLRQFFQPCRLGRTTGCRRSRRWLLSPSDFRGKSQTLAQQTWCS